MNNKGFTTIELLVVLGIFSIVYFAGVVNFTYAFETDEIEVAYDHTINLIELQAKEYALNNQNIFETDTVVYVYVKDLIEYNYLAAENGIIIDPRETNKNLNDIKIKLEKNGENISSSIVEI